MKTPLPRFILMLGNYLRPRKFTIALAAAFFSLVGARAQTTVGIDPTYAWIGYMNVYDLNPDYSMGAYEFGEVWGTADLRAYFTGTNSLTLTLNTNVWNPTNTYWVNADGTPNKFMDASFYVQNDTLAGQTVTFIGTCLSNSLVGPNSNSVAFIKDFTSSYSLFNFSTAPLTPGQPFNISLTTTSGHHIQFGFETQGPDVAPTNLVNSGNVVLAVGTPDPSVSPLTSIAAVEGQNVTFAVTAKGTSPFSYQWIYDGSTVLANGGRISGATTSSLTISNVQQSDAGTYSVTVANVNGSTSASALLTVVPLAQAQTNLLLDPGFESGVFSASSTAGWEDFNGAAFANTNDLYANSTNLVEVIDGTNCFDTYSTGAGSYNGCYQDRPTLPGQVYTGYIWMRTPSSDQIGGAGTCILEVQFRDSNGNVLQDNESSPITTNSPTDVWIKMLPTNIYAGDFVTFLGNSPYAVAPPNSASIRFQVTYHADTGGSVYADAAVLRLREPVATTTLTATQFKITFPTLAGPNYQVYYKNHLTDLSWTPLGTPVAGDGTAKTVTDVRTAGQRFYIVNTK